MNSERHDSIIRKYFSDKDKELRLKSGDILLKQYELNDRLFYIQEGKLCGFLPDKSLHEPVFEAEAQGFVGVYSFFSADSVSYSHVVAEQDSIIKYFDGDPFKLPEQDAQELLSFLFSIVVGELRHRQHFAGKMAHERQETLQKLIQSEKMVTLGQMAAGLAHELNNSIASLSSNLGQIKETIGRFLATNESKQIQSYFQSGVDDGQKVSSAEARDLRRSYGKFDHLNKKTAKKLSRAGVASSELEKITKKDKEQATKIAELWELGYLIHDMQIASNQAAHVIQSVKSVGVANQSWSKDVDVNKTVSEALVILRSLTKNIDVESECDPDIPLTEACSGELVQVWINLIKNAAESLNASSAVDPKISIKTGLSGKRICVSVIDSGPGIPQDLNEKVFQPNFTTKVGGLSFGLGLGLTIVKRIVNEHNGSIEVESKPGRTEFKIYLPVVH